ncbi:MAG: hypothetical protein ABW252_17860 [Polyangiales bacterium]
MKLLSSTVTFLFGLSAASAVADDVHLHDFERAGDAAAWSAADARNCSAANPGKGGSPGGYLELDCKASTLAGVHVSVADLARDLAGKRGSIALDLVQRGGARAGVFELVLRGPRGSWSYARSWDDALAGAWQTYRLPFDPSWSDGQAILHGWYANPLSWAADAEQDGWAATVRDVRGVSLYFVGAEGPLRVGIDNVEVGAEP